MAENQTADPPKKSSAGTVVRVVILVAIIAAVITMWIHGQKLGKDHARMLGQPEADAKVVLPWDWTGPQWKAWVGMAEPAAVSSSR